MTERPPTKLYQSIEKQLRKYENRKRDREVLENLLI